MTGNPSHEAPPDTAQADRLYRGFPVFSAWGELTPTDRYLWSRFASSLEERRKAVTPEALKAAVDVAVRAAALDTGAIEGLYTTDWGFTMTVALQHLAWEQMIEERGAGIRELFEAQLEAYELVLDAVTRKLPITEAWIRALHEKLCSPQKTYRVLTEVSWQEQELPKGQYKTRPNHVRLADGSVHAYAPVDRLPAEMHRLLEQIRTPEFETAHPVLQASYIHYAFVVIHPFADGNGRVARALASVFFYRAESIPLVIFANQRLAYLDALAMADQEDHREVISFFLDRGVDTMQLVSESLMTAEMPHPVDMASQIGPIIAPRRSLSSDDIDSIAIRLSFAIIKHFKSQMKRLRPLGFSLATIKEPASQKARYGYKATLMPVLALRLEAKGYGSSDLHIMVFSARNPAYPFPLMIAAQENEDRLEVRLEDAYPELTHNLRGRMSNWVQRQLGRMLEDLER